MVKGRQQSDPSIRVWINDYPYQDGTVRAFSARGNGGQLVVGVPELDLLVAFTGGNYSDRVMHTPQQVYLPEHILPAIARETRPPDSMRTVNA